ncbi:MAG: PQQ-dependent sugar dehydrogenase [Candidatus Competibacteraceae bacterium]|nr:PQQ-dependent sugar dehydrogenase [Candidatus Competibacteraceae bacterium]MBK8962992.1 PQQ-dependent sugar dehydrogenase [Candidatus Competibacteraceae bacterium]MBK9953073.1 PQQ-dependent sugar dehydrogenase [Candidatus Competibacteraceae bacterium]
MSYCSRSNGWWCGLLAIALLWAWLPGAAARVTLREVANGLSQPLAIAHAGDGSGRLFVTLQEGRVMIFDGRQIVPKPFLDLRERVASGGERGLLSVAFHPDFANNRWFYVNYTDLAGNTVVSRFRAARRAPNVALRRSETLVLSVTQPYANHNGGQLQFGPDGFLYIGTGDGGSGGDPENRAQDGGSLLGKLLRIDVNQSPYGIPTDNPFSNRTDIRPEIWAVGLRNPWRFSFDRATGDLYIADVGQDAWEEVNFQPAAGPGGLNYGWRRLEGRHCFNPPNACDDGTLTPPVLEYDHSVGESVTGGYVYRGSQVPELAGRYVYGDFISGRIWAARLEGSRWVNEEVAASPIAISSFGEDEAGELYLTDYIGGRLLKFVSE